MFLEAGGGDVDVVNPRLGESAGGEVAAAHLAFSFDI